MAAECILTLRVAPWWIACFNAAIQDENWQWAEWLSRNPSVLILGAKDKPIGMVGRDNASASGLGGARGA